MKRKVLAVITAITMTATLVACTDASAPAPAPAAPAAEAPAAEEAAPAAEPEAPAAEDAGGAGGEITIGYAPATLNNPFWLAVEDGVKKSISEHPDYKVNLVEVDANGDQAVMNDRVSELLNSGIDCLLIAPADSSAAKQALQDCQGKNVPVINFDTPVPETDMVKSIIASDNYNAGYVVGQDMASKLNDGDKYLVLHSPRASACVQRYDGFIKALEESGKKFVEVNNLDGKGDQQESLTVATSALVADPDLAAIFCVNDPSAMGAQQAIEQSDVALTNDHILVYGVDGNPDMKKLVKEGKTEGTGSQSPESIGYQSMETAFQVLAGEEVEANQVVPTFLITKENVDEYGTDGWQ